MNAGSQDFPRITTARLTLRRFEERDLTDLLDYRNDPEVERWQGWGSFNEERGRQLIDTFMGCEIGLPGQDNAAQIAFELRSTGRLVGDAMLQVSAEDPSIAIIGYTISPRHQRRGLGREGVSAVLAYAVPALRLQRIEASTLIDNVASAGLLTSLGFKHCPGAPTGEQRYRLETLEFRSLDI